MNIDMVVIDANKTIGKNPVLVDVTPAYVYENGKRTRIAFYLVFSS